MLEQCNENVELDAASNNSASYNVLFEHHAGGHDHDVSADVIRSLPDALARK